MTVRNVRQRFCLGQEAAAQDGASPSTKTLIKRIKRAHQVNRPKRTFDGETEAKLVALACSSAPEGANRWTLQLLHDRLIEMQVVEKVGKETIRQTLKKIASSRG